MRVQHATGKIGGLQQRARYHESGSFRWCGFPCLSHLVLFRATVVHPKTSVNHMNAWLNIHKPKERHLHMEISQMYHTLPVDINPRTPYIHWFNTCSYIYIYYYNFHILFPSFSIHTLVLIVLCMWIMYPANWIKPPRHLSHHRQPLWFCAASGCGRLGEAILSEAQQLHQRTGRTLFVFVVRMFQNQTTDFRLSQGDLTSNELLISNDKVSLKMIETR